MGSLIIEYHPRIYGEQVALTTCLATFCGSPPHARGTEITCCVKSIPAGITPAYTGNSDEYNYWMHYYRDHPRIHGEHTKQIPVNQQSQLAKQQILVNLQRHRYFDYKV